MQQQPEAAVLDHLGTGHAPQPGFAVAEEAGQQGQFQTGGGGLDLQGMARQVVTYRQLREGPKATVVTLLCDSGIKYLSTELYRERGAETSVSPSSVSSAR